MDDETRKKKLRAYARGGPVTWDGDGVLYEVVVCDLLGLHPKAGGLHDQPQEWIEWTLVLLEERGKYQEELRERAKRRAAIPRSVPA